MRWRGGWRGAAVTAAWAAAVTVAGGLGAWSLAGSDGDGGRARPLDDTAVREALTAGPSHGSPTPSGTGAAGPKPTESPYPAKPPHHSTVRFTGGTATAECRADGSVYLVSWSPTDGYSVEEYARGPAPSARIELEPGGDDGEDLTYAIRCGESGRAGAVPVRDKDDD
ncbi:hypothetical protein [Streptomyces sp. NPDC002851]